MRLFMVELNRFWGRRITWVTLALMTSLLLLGVGIAFARTSGKAPTGESTISVNQECVDDLTEARDAGDPQFGDLSDQEIANDYCADRYSDPDGRFWATTILGDKTSDWSSNQSMKEREGSRTITVGSEEYKSSGYGNEGIVPGLSLLLLAVAVVLGGSYVGAE